MPISDYWELIGAGVDAAVMLVLYKVYKSKVKEADLIKSTPLYQVGDELELAIDNAENNVLPYVCIEGVTKAMGKPLRSHYVDDEMGVIQHLLLVEHKSRRTQGHWRDQNRTLMDQLNICSFAIADKNYPDDNPFVVRATNPKSAQLLMQHLTDTHDQFEYNKAGWFARFIDWCVGEKNKGIQTTEKMLLVGVPFIAVGQVRYDAGTAIVEPSASGHAYILTNLSRSEAVKALKSAAFSYKVTIAILGVGGAGLVGLWCYRTYVKRRGQTQS